MPPVDQQRALRVGERDVGATGEPRDVHRPGAAGVDVQAGAHDDRRTGAVVAAHRGPDRAVGDLEPDELGVRAVDAAGDDAGVVDVRQREVERVDRGIGHAERPGEALRQVRLLPPRFGDRKLVAADPRLRAEVGKPRAERRVVALDGDEQPAGGLDATGGQPLQQLVLLPALDRGLEVGRDVPGSRVQQPVIAPRGSGAQVHLVDEDRVHATKREVAHDARAGDPAADDQHFGVERRRAGRVGLRVGVCVHGVVVGGLVRHKPGGDPSLVEKPPPAVAPPCGSPSRPENTGSFSRAAP